MSGGFLVRSEAGSEILSVKTRWRVQHWRVVREGPRMGLEGDGDNQFSEIRALVTHYRSGDRVGDHYMTMLQCYRRQSLPNTEGVRLR